MLTPLTCEICPCPFVSSPPIKKSPGSRQQQEGYGAAEHRVVLAKPESPCQRKRTRCGYLKLRQSGVVFGDVVDQMIVGGGGMVGT